MFKQLTTKELVFISLMAASIFVINVLTGAGVVAATGIPLSSAFVTAITMGIWALLLFKIVPKPGTFTLFLLIYSILELPTFLGGAPGFWPKIPINVISGLLADVFLYSARYRTWSVYVAFYVIATANLLAFIFFLWLLGIPGVEKTIAIAHIIIIAYSVLGTIGILIGTAIYRRIKDKRIVMQIRQ